MQIHGITYRQSQPGIAADGSQKQIRIDQYGSQHMRSEIMAWAEEGSYYRALSNATPMTGVAQAITTAFSATAVPLVMVNGSSTTRVIPHYIRATCTAAGSTTTSSSFAISIDSVNRYSSGGTDLSTLIFNANSGLGPASGLSVLRVGTVTASAASGTTRLVAQGQLKVQAAPCWTVGDEILWTFGEPSNAGAAGPISGAAAIVIVKNVGPVVLGGQNHSMILHHWNPANATTAPSWSYEVAWFER